MRIVLRAWAILIVAAKRLVAQRGLALAVILGLIVAVALGVSLPLYADAMKAIAAERKCDLVDLHTLFIEALKKKPADVKGTWLTSDGVHMKPLGNAVMAVGILRGLGVPDDKLAATEIPLPPPPKPAAPKPAAPKPPMPTLDAPNPPAPVK